MTTDYNIDDFGRMHGLTNTAPAPLGTLQANIQYDGVGLRRLIGTQVAAGTALTSLAGQQTTEYADNQRHNTGSSWQSQTPGTPRLPYNFSTPFDTAGNPLNPFTLGATTPTAMTTFTTPLVYDNMDRLVGWLAGNGWLLNGQYQYDEEGNL